jgi:hypothetical protein
MKIWSSYEKGDDKIIAYLNGTIYRGNPTIDEIDTFVFNFKMQEIPAKNFTAIPLHYLKQINLENGRNYIEILFGSDSTEHLRIKDADKRKEIFEYLKSNIPNAKFYIDKYSKIRAGKKPLIAMFIVTLIFLWTFYIANGMENGNEYGVTGDHKDSLAGIVLALASLGTKNIALLFGTFFTIALIAFFRKTKNPTIIQRIQIRA